MASRSLLQKSSMGGEGEGDGEKKRKKKRVRKNKSSSCLFVRQSLSRRLHGSPKVGHAGAELSKTACLCSLFVCLN